LRNWRARLRILWFACGAGMVIASVAGLVSLLRQPFDHPRVQFLFLTGADLSGNVAGYFDQPGVAFPDAELAALTRVRQLIFEDAGQPVVTLDRWRSASDMRSLGLKLVQPDLSTADVAVIEIVAAGVSEEGEARLCWNFDRPGDAPGRVRVADLLQQITVSTRAHKLLILEAGNVDVLPQQGMLVNDFPRLLESVVESTGDSSLWVLCSHGPLERSHVLGSLHRSVFGYFAEQGLTGAADLDGDRQIDVRELHTWVAHAVAGYVDRRTGGMESQTPRLYWGGGPRIGEQQLPVIVPVRQSSTGGKPGKDRPQESVAEAPRPAAESAGDKPQTGTKDAAAPAEPPPTPDQLLAEVWRFSEKLRVRDTESVTAVDLAPRLLRELAAHQRACEVLLQGAGNVSPQDVSNALLPVVTPLRGITSTPPVLPGTGTGLGTRLARELGPPALPALPIDSLAMAEMLAARNIHPLPEGYAELGAALDKFIVQDERTGFDEWVAKLKPGELRLAELKDVGTFAGIPDLAWPLLKKALAVRRNAERTAVLSLGRQGIIGADVLRGDRSRITAERLILDGVQPARASRAAAEFETALAAYQSAARHATSFADSWHLKNDLVVRAPEYIRWRRAAALRSDTAGPEFDLIVDFLTELARYCDLVEIEQAGDRTEIADLSARLKELQRRIERSAAADAVRRLADSPSGPEDIAQIESLLATSLVPADLRQPLLTARDAAISEISLEVAPLDIRRQVTAPRIVLLRQRQCLSQQIELELLLAQLAEIPGDVPSGNGSHLARLTQEIQKVRNCERDCAAHPESDKLISSWWEACRVFAQELQAWNRELTGRMQAGLQARTSEAAEVARVARALRGVPRTLALLRLTGRGSSSADDLIRGMRLAEWRELMVFLSRRAAAALPDAPPADAELLAASAERYREAAATINPVPQLSQQPAPSIQLSGERELSLSLSSESELLVTVRNLRSMPRNVWVVVDYDPDLLDVRPPVDYAVIREPKQAAGEIERLRDPATPTDIARSGVPPSLSLAAGAERSLKFVVRRRGSRTWPTKLIVKATGDDGSVRHECLVQIPAPDTIDLVVGGPEGSWTATPFGYILHPFPNQRTAFQLLLRNRGSARVLDLELYPLERSPAVALPGGTLPAEQAGDLLRSFSLGQRLAAVSSFKLEGDGALHGVPFTGPPPPDLDKPAAAEKAPSDVKPGIAELPVGALLIITEPASGTKILKRFEFGPQRPRRYVMCRVEYRPDAQVIDISVRRRPNVVSPERVKVRCELGDISAAGAPRRRVVGELNEGEAETRFTLPVPAAGDGLHLAVAIDDYPRAFLYRISSRLPGGEVFEDTGFLAVRVTLPESQNAFACPVQFVNAGVEIDAPAGVLSDSHGFWEIGIDKDLDRELAGDNVVRFVTDRQAKPKLNGYFPDGRLAIDTQVRDFQVQIPAEGLCNQRALIVAHASVPGRNAWSLPVEIVLDGSGPRVTGVAIRPDRPLVNGDEVEVVATVVDGALSGVAKVEMAFDLEGTGRFVKDPPPLPAALSPTGSWVARLATAKMPPGTYLILVRGIDKVGNVGEYGRTSVTLYSKEDLEAQRAAIRVTLRGAVEYNKMPIPGAKVWVVPVESDPKAGAAATGSGDKKAADKKPAAPEPAEPIPPVKTDQDGLFVLPKVPLGKFKLQTEANFRNKIRKAELEITVDEQTPFGPALKLKLP